MATYAYNMDCDMSAHDGYIDSGSWAVNSGSGWSPVSGTPAISVGDSVQFAVRDTSNPSQQINGTTVAIAIAAMNGVGDDHKPPVASPFSSGGRLVCMETAPGIADSGYWRVGPFPVNAVAAGSSKLKFEFLVVVTATYSDGTTQQFSWDPEMDIRGSR